MHEAQRGTEPKAMLSDSLDALAAMRLLACFHQKNAMAKFSGNPYHLGSRRPGGSQRCRADRRDRVRESKIDVEDLRPDGTGSWK
jgi:hypothetical protein